MNKQPKSIPKFANEAEKQAFWSKEDSTVLIPTEN